MTKKTLLILLLPAFAALWTVRCSGQAFIAFESTSNRTDMNVCLAVRSCPDSFIQENMPGRHKVVKRVSETTFADVRRYLSEKIAPLSEHWFGDWSYAWQFRDSLNNDLRLSNTSKEYSGIIQWVESNKKRFAKAGDYEAVISFFELSSRLNRVNFK